MKGRTTRGLAPGLILTLILALSLISTPGRALEEGGYAGTTNQGHDAVVYNFLKHFNYEQYYYAREHQWAWNNDNRVDAMDFAIFGGHGNPWSIKTLDGWMDLDTIGSMADWGWGDNDAEFVAFESCKVVTSPIDTSDWWTNWVKEPDGPMDGVHQILGFRTDSWQATDEDITDEFGHRIAQGYAVWQAWFDAIDSEGSNEYGSAVMYPPTDGDTYYSVASDPPYNHQWLRVWYQH